MAGPCENLRVLDLTWGMAGSLATMLLADYGAEVIRVEKPGAEIIDTEAGYRLWNRGKKSVFLDLSEPAQKELFLKLSREVDAIVLTMRPRTVKELGIDYETLARVNPGIIYATITGFGWSSPFSDRYGYEGLVDAVLGFMSIRGGFREGPIYNAPPIGSFGAALLCVHGVLAALYALDRTIQGQHVDISILSGILLQKCAVLTRAERFQEDLASRAYAMKDPLGPMPMCNLNQCADGRWVSLACLNRVFTERALKAMDSTDLLQDPRFGGIPRLFNKEEDRMAFVEAVRQRIARFTSKELMRRFDENDVPAELVLTVEEFTRHPQIIANNLRVDVDDPVVGTMMQQGLLVNFSRTPGAIKPAPVPGQHTREILAGLASTPKAVAETPAAEDSPASMRRGPLAKIRVLDLTQFLAGPLATTLLADMGAEVIKVEPLAGDNFRNVKDTFTFCNRGKKSLAVDLKSKEGLQVLERLVKTADVFCHNFRPGVAERMGISYKDLKSWNDKIIYAWFTGFGVKGPQRDRPSYDYSLGAISGVYVQQGGQDNPPSSLTLADINGSHAAATGILMALFNRSKTGMGQMLETSFLAAMAHFDGDGFTQYAGKPPDPIVDHGQNGIGALYRLYQTRQGWLFLACGRDKHWQALKQVLGEPQLESELFQTRESREKHRDELAAVLAPIFITKAASEWDTILSAKDIPGAVVAEDIEQPFLMPQAKKLQWVTWVKHPLYGRVRQAGPAYSFSRMPLKIREAEPLLGEDTDAILKSLGYSAAQIREFHEHEAVG